MDISRSNHTPPLPPHPPTHPSLPLYTHTLSLLYPSIPSQTHTHTHVSNSLDSGLPHLIRGMYHLNCPPPLKSVAKARQCFHKALEVSCPVFPDTRVRVHLSVCMCLYVCVCICIRARVSLCQLRARLPVSVCTQTNPFNINPPHHHQVNPRSGRNLYFAGLGAFLEGDYSRARAFYRQVRVLGAGIGR